MIQNLNWFEVVEFLGNGIIGGFFFWHLLIWVLVSLNIFELVGFELDMEKACGHGLLVSFCSEVFVECFIT